MKGQLPFFPYAYHYQYPDEPHELPLIHDKLDRLAVGLHSVLNDVTDHEIQLLGPVN